MSTNSLTSPQATPADARSEVAELAARVATLERNARRWRVGFAAMCLVVVGMGAYAVNDATFGTVKASKFEVVTDKGESVAALAWGTVDGSKNDEGYLLVVGEGKKKATFVNPGVEPKIVDRTK